MSDGLSRWERMILTLGGAGYSPIAPGTAGSIVACVAFWILPQTLRWPGFLLFAPAFAAAVFLCHRAVGQFNAQSAAPFPRLRKRDSSADDPDEVVLDEMLGQWIPLIFVPHTIAGFGLAFILFRFFDIVKPLGVRSLQDAPRGWGIVLDDVLAGIYAAIVVITIRLIMAYFEFRI